MIDIDYDKLKSELKAAIKAELDAEQKVAVKDEEIGYTSQKQFNKQINNNRMIQKQYQGQVADADADADNEVKTDIDAKAYSEAESSAAAISDCADDNKEHYC